MSMAGKESESGFRKEAGKWAIAGGIIAGIIGLIASGKLLLAGLALAGGGWMLKRD